MTTQATPAASSALLLAANERLLALRRERGISGAWPETQQPLAAADGQQTTADGASRKDAETSRKDAKNAKSITHIGRLLGDLGAIATEGLPASPLAPPAPLPASPLAPYGSVKVYPDLALAMLREGVAAAGRVWLLLRTSDTTGAGRLDRDEALRLLSDAGSPLRIVARRQAANLLRDGEGRFWETRDGRLWLRSVARVAASLGVSRLAAAPVAVPLSGLTGGIGQARAQLYATFHSSRAKERPGRLARGRAIGPAAGSAATGAPIARQTLQRLSNAVANTQRAYDRRAGVVGRSCYAVGPQHTTAEAQEQAWQRGRAVFALVDRGGRLGRPGARYVAWQLPNEYTGPHARLSRGRMKRINRRIAGLLAHGMTGNSAPATDARPVLRRRFFGDGAAVAAAERRTPAGVDLYWRGPGRMWYRVRTEEASRPLNLPLLCQPTAGAAAEAGV